MKRLIIFASIGIASLCALTFLYFNSKANSNMELFKSDVQALTDDDEAWRMVPIENSSTTQYYVPVPMSKGQKLFVSSLVDILGFVTGVPTWISVAIFITDKATIIWGDPPVYKYIKCCGDGYDTCYPWAPDKNPVECNSDYDGNSHGKYYYEGV